MEKRSNDRWSQLGLYSGLGVQLAVLVGGGLWLGDYLDRQFSTQPWLALTGLVLGAVASFYQLIKIVKNKNHE
ncbi:MAG: AtpZ/AtpI family protein [Deltaproteobacteria bacterium]|nr:AtpZ/AtpI family protein [Deltaproteobacteria bacterium]